jgi:predicted PurR-regulated permease PerM
MPTRTSSNRARVRWASKRRKFRRRWPVYLVMLIVCVTTVAIGIIIASNVDEPAKAAPTPIPRAIR